MSLKIASLLFASSLTLPALAGEPAPPPASAAVTQPASEWELLVTLPMWAAGISGDVGIAGFDPVAIDVPFKDVFDNLDMVAALTLETRHRRWGLVLDGMYLKMSASGGTPGRLLTAIDVQVEQVLAEAAITYRLLEGERGYLDFIAGARYVYLGSELNFHLDSAGVRDVSHDLSDAIVDHAVDVVRGEVDKAAAKAKAKLAALNLNQRADALRGDIRDQAIERILEDHTLGEIIGAIRDLTPAQREQIRQKVEGSREILAANKALAQAVIQERVSSAVASARKKAQQAVARAKKQLAKAIESSIRRAIPEQVAGSKSWVDPFVGFRGRLLLTDRVYLSARADIGGFGVASDLTWNAVGAIGCQLNKNWSAEIGWRYLVIDYSNGGFVYDTETSGLFMGLTRRL